MITIIIVMLWIASVAVAFDFGYGAGRARGYNAGYCAGLNWFERVKWHATITGDDDAAKK